MTNLSTSFLSLEDEETCLLCKSSFKKKDTVNVFTQKGWPKLIVYALKWKNINLPADHEYFMFTVLHENIRGVANAFGRAHEKSRITLSTKSAQHLKTFGELLVSDERETPVCVGDEKPTVNVTPPATTRAFSSATAGTCFFCTEQRASDENTYDTGGLRMLLQSDTALPRLDGRTEEYLKSPDHPYYKAACRYSVQADWMRAQNATELTGIYIHQSCYIK